MGTWASCLWKKPVLQVCLLGRNAAGKTTLLYRLKDGVYHAHLMPTIGFNMETIERTYSRLIISEHGGGWALRQLAYKFCEDADAMVFVLDSSNRDDAPEAARELHDGLASQKCQTTPLLIWANKQDLPGAMPLEDVCDLLNLRALQSRPWHVEGCSAATGEGLEEGLKWLEVAIRETW